MKFYVPFLVVVMSGMALVGCSDSGSGVLSDEASESMEVVEVETVENSIDERLEGESMRDAAEVVLPVEGYVEGRTFKAFGEWIQDRFTGYHVGDDVEFADLREEVPVYAIAGGEVTRADFVSGYGGLIVVRHAISDREVTAIYGHVDLGTSEVSVGDSVERGQVLAFLGDHESAETDGERKHLHFALYEGSARINGYESAASSVFNWINPQDFFAAYGVDMTSPARSYYPDVDLGGSIFNLEFTIPEGWELEYIPSLEALSLFTLSGEGAARERSQILIRYFDATQFLTLNTVTIHSTEDLVVGTEDYVARRYDIEKKSGVADFSDQPSWRNQRHLVTDFRASDGFTRYYVVAAHPDLDPAVYEEILASMRIR